MRVFLLKHPSRDSGVTPHSQEGPLAVDKQGHQVRWPESERVKLMYKSEFFGLFPHVGT